ncbi:glutamate receptor [Salix suchowensis]|nr:glutamate receptor [Salix suchowensis]
MDGVLALSYSILLLSVKFISSNAGQVNNGGSNFINGIGGVVDCNTRVGREEKIAMDIAVQDVYSSTGHNLTTHIQDLSGKSDRAASSAFHLSQSRKLLAIVGSLTWQQAALVSEMNGKANEVPVISLITAISPIMPEEKLHVISMYQDISFEMNCISSIISYFKWTKVIAIYEDRSSYSNDLGIITLLSNSLRVSGVELEHYSMFPALSFLTDPDITIQRELNILRSKQSRVFVLLQSSLTLTTLLFEKAMEMGMMGKGYVWITADGITSLLDSMDSTVVTSMQGVIGFKTYYSVTTAPFRKFEVKFRRKFRAEYPEEDSSRPSVFALRAYDAIQTIAKSAKMLQEKNYSKTLIQHILSSDFDGLSGRIQFKNYKLSEVPVFQIVNTVGKSYRELGFWSSKFDVLGPVYWPDGRTLVPRGLAETDIGEERRTTLRIAVPATSMFKQFVKVSHDENQNVTLITGFSINVFESVVKCLQYQLIYDMVPFHGSYDEMVTAVSEKIYDAAVGDIVITANKHQLIEFSQPYLQSGLVTVVNEEFRGSPARQMGTILWFSFSTLVFPRGSPLALNISEAIIYLTQNGELQKLEEETLPFPKCSTSTSDATGIQSIGPGPFSILFKIAFGGSTIALLFAVFRLLGKRWREVTLILSMLMDRGLWMWLAALFTQKKNNYELELSMESSNPARRINST